MNTKMQSHLTPDERKKCEEQTLLNRFAEPEEIARIVRFLAMDECNYIVGETIIANGGILFQ